MSITLREIKEKEYSCFLKYFWEIRVFKGSLISRSCSENVLQTFVAEGLFRDPIDLGSRLKSGCVWYTDRSLSANCCVVFTLAGVIHSDKGMSGKSGDQTQRKQIFVSTFNL